MRPDLSTAVLLAQTADAPHATPLITSLARGMVASVIYATIGLVLFAVAFFLINKTMPFSIRKEIEEDQNPAVGIVLAAVIIGISMILAAAIHG